jgi:hypothetical protein
MAGGQLGLGLKLNGGMVYRTTRLGAGDAALLTSGRFHAPDWQE